MSSIVHRTEQALNESRTMVLGVQVSLGFHYRVVFEKAFQQLPASARYLSLAGLSLLLVAILLFMAPVSYQIIVDEGRDEEKFQDFVTVIITAALLPFALALGFDAYVCTLPAAPAAAVMSGVAAAVGTLFCWYGIALIARGRSSKAEMMEKRVQEVASPKEPTSLSDRIKQALTECRIVIPGAQALSGFQFLVLFAEGFKSIPPVLKYMHLASLACVVVCTVLLMTPAAYHRIVDQGEDAEEFFQFTGRVTLAALAALGLGLVSDFYVALEMVLHNPVVSGSLSALAFIGLNGLWFGYTLYLRGRRRLTVLPPSAVPLRS